MFNSSPGACILFRRVFCRHNRMFGRSFVRFTFGQLWRVLMLQGSLDLGLSSFSSCPGPLGIPPVRIRVRIGPQHPLVCRKRRLNRAVLRMRPEKPRSRVTARCGTIKIPPCSKALSAEHKPKFCSPSPAMVTSPYK
jgi:hypothetical protein